MKLTLPGFTAESSLLEVGHFVSQEEMSTSDMKIVQQQLAVHPNRTMGRNGTLHRPFWRCNTVEGYTKGPWIFDPRRWQFCRRVYRYFDTVCCYGSGWSQICHRTLRRNDPFYLGIECKDVPPT
jgi:hypothetical protein